MDPTSKEAIKNGAKKNVWKSFRDNAYNLHGQPCLPVC